MKSRGIPVFPNWFPYNDMLLDGRLGVGPYAGVKTRNWDWTYRGLVLLYNSLRTAQPAVAAYQYQDGPLRHKVIIGAAELVNVRPLTFAEALQMVCNFNNLSPEKVNRVLGENGFSLEGDGDISGSPLFYFYEFGPYVAPLEIGFFFRNVKRFRDAVPFHWPPGPIKPIFTKVTRGSRLHTALSRVGISVVGGLQDG